MKPDENQHHESDEAFARDVAEQLERALALLEGRPNADQLRRSLQNALEVAQRLIYEARAEMLH